MHALLLENAAYVIGERIYRDASVYIEDGRICWVGTGDVPAGTERISARKCAVLPALTNAHTHLPETVLRGLCDDRVLMDWLNKYIWPAENKLTNEFAEWAALLGCAELIHNGVGFFIDQYFYANEIARSVLKAGIKALLCPSVFDGCPEGKTIERQFAIAEKFIREWQGKSTRLYVGIGPHAPYTVNDEYLARINEIATSKNLHVHIHLSETQHENAESRKKFGMSPARRLSKLGMLNKRALLAHCVHLSEEDIALIAGAGATVLHCPQSNLKLSSGIAQIERIRKRVNVLVGTDGNASNNNLDVLEELRTACMLQKYLFGAEAMPLQDAFSMISSNAAALGCNYTGIIKPGAPADIAVMPLEKPHLQPVHDILSNLIYSANGTDVSTLIIDGEIIMQDYRILRFDEGEVLEKCREIAQAIWNQ
jgi:5-methylthioadenosine/S-adenosylhomocysteine deaminase